MHWFSSGGNEDENGKVELDPSKFTHAVDIKFPDVAGKGTIVWNKKEGDLIQRGELICDIVLEDFSFGIESEDETDTLMGEILVLADETVQPETPICTILHPEEVTDAVSTEDSTNDGKQNVKK